MEVINDQLIVSTKRSEAIAIAGSLSNIELKLSDFDSLVCHVKEVKNITSRVLFVPIVVVDNDEFIIYIPSRTAERLPSKCYLDLKGLIGEDVTLLFEAEINIQTNVTKIF